MEIIFAIFYLSGLIKSFLIFYKIHFPIDFTLFLSILVIAVALYDLKNKKISFQFNKNNLLAIISLAIFYFWMLLSLLWTPSEHYSLKKALFFLPNILGFLVPLFYKKFNMAKFFRFVSISLIVISIFFVNIYLSYVNGKASKEHYDSILGLYLVCATYMGLNVLVILGSHQRIFKSLFVSSFVVTASFIMMFLLGARGPLIFTLVLLLPLLFFKWIKIFYFEKLLVTDLKKIFFSILTIIMFSGVFFIFENEISFLVERSLVRLELLVPTKSAPSNGGSMGTSVDTRIDQLNFGVKLIKSDRFSSIYGYGLGSFGVLYSGKDIRAYPHNVFLEIWIELGLIGLFLFLIFLWFVFTTQLNGYKIIGVFVLFYIILNVLKSSSFIDIRSFFAIFGMYMLVSNTKKKSN